MIIKLGEVASFVNGYAFKPSDWSDNGMPIIRIQDLTGNSYKMNRYNGDIEQKYKVQDGDVLISWSASLGVYVWHGENAVLNQHIFKVVFDKTDVSKDYFVYQIEYRLGNAASEAHGATMKHLTKSVFNALPFYLPKKEEQEKIAKVLNKITELTNKTRKQAKLLDDIIKSRFIEMFGDPDVNNKGWNIYRMEQLCEVGSSKRIYQNEQSIRGIPFLRVSDLVNRIDTGSKECDLYISRERFEKLKEQGLTPASGDILLTARGTLGRCYIIQDGDEFYFQDGMITWLSKFDTKITPLYITYLFEMSGFRKQIVSLQSGSTVAYLSISMTKKLDVMVPPIELQNQFADFVAQTDKSKLAVQKSLDELETLKKSLMQEYFG